MPDIVIFVLALPRAELLFSAYRYTVNFAIFRAGEKNSDESEWGFSKSLIRAVALIIRFLNRYIGPAKK